VTFSGEKSNVLGAKKDGLAVDAAGTIELAPEEAAQPAAITGRVAPAAADEAPAGDPVEPGQEDLLLIFDEAVSTSLIDALSGMTSRDLREIFQRADLDESGFLTLTELEDLMRSRGDLAPVARIFAQIDNNHDGRVSAAEFISYILRTKAAMGKTEDIRKAFTAADADGSGTISLEELEKMLGAKTKKEKANVRKAFAEMDQNGDGVLQMDEFARFFGQELVTPTLEVEITAVSDTESESEG
jgi:Ca2+-binding EF-hand superfamily protein